MGKFIITEEEKNRIRGLYEQQTSTNNKIAEDVFNKISNALGTITSARNVIDGVYDIQNDQVYNLVLNKVKTLNKNYQTIMHWISTKMPYTQKGVVGTLKAIVGADNDTDLTQISNHLKRFNSKEVIYDKK